MHRSATLLLLALCAAFLFATLFALGTWQLYRLQWKTDLIERVEQRVHAPPAEVPAPEEWAEISTEHHEYRRVRLTGTFLSDRSARVQASTALGSGYWLMTPLRTTDGFIVLVNRGFIPSSDSSAAQPVPPGAEPASGTVSVTGLLRMSEPGGGFLRENDPANQRWYSRDVQALAAAHGLSPVAPFFVDAAAPADAAAAAPAHDTPPRYPVPGLTVVSFPNNHLVYALTWYALALMVAGAALWVARDEFRRRRGGEDMDRDGA